MEQNIFNLNEDFAVHLLSGSVLELHIFDNLDIKNNEKGQQFPQKNLINYLNEKDLNIAL